APALTPLGAAEREVLAALNALEIDTLRPVEALGLLDRWRQRLRHPTAPSEGDGGGQGSG
ncbi:MAG: hypothetical protein PVF43_15210, partial [Candidatus Eiseniibacteriota bacterium]